MLTTAFIILGVVALLGVYCVLYNGRSRPNKKDDKSVDDSVIFPPGIF